MPLVECPDCGRKVSGRAYICLNCGRPIKQYDSSTSEIDNEKNTGCCLVYIFYAFMILAGFLFGIFILFKIVAVLGS